MGVDQLSEKPQKSVTRWLIAFTLVCVFVTITTLIFGHRLSTPPRNFEAKSLTIPFGASVADIANQLERENVVRSSSFLYIVLLTMHDSSTLKAGQFNFSAPQSVFAVAETLTTTIPREAEYTVTFPEGFTHFEFNQFVPEALAASSAQALAEHEGYLFPDTYFVPTSFSLPDLITLMRENFTKKIGTLEAQIQASGLTQEEVVILASIIEREANDPVSMGLVSGVLYNRLEIGMALQVDASVAYGLGINGTELTRADLEADGPFNTYTRTGLPPTPIANPGLGALTAAVEPTPNTYLFYITGNDGNFYYAETLDEHNENIARYLR